MTWLSSVLAIVSKLLDLIKGKADDKRTAIEEKKKVESSEEFLRRKQKNEEVRARDEAELLVLKTKAAQTPEEKQAALEEIRRKVSK